MSEPIPQQPGKIRKGQRVPFRKCTEFQRNERIQILANLISNRPIITDGELKRFVKKQFNLQWQQAMIYISRAKALIRDRARMPKKELADIIVGKLLYIANHGEEHASLKAVSMLINIAGIEAPKRVEQSGPGGKPLQITTTSLSPQRLKEILADFDRSQKERNHGPTSTPTQTAAATVPANGNGNAR